MHVSSVNKLNEEDLEELFEDEHLLLSAKASISTIHFLKSRIVLLEKVLAKAAKLKNEYKLLKTVPGIWNILAQMIMFETGSIERFKKVGNYASYCRCVQSNRLSNSKSKGKGNRRNGNKYLSWAFVEAANHALWNYEYVRRYYQRKTVRTNNIVAIKAVAHKLARACYYIIRDQKEFDPAKAFA